MSPEVEPKHAKLTRFLCQELLYEYETGTLERRRRQDVENYLTGCHDSQRELANLKKGMAYTKDVATIQVSPSLHQALLAFEPAWKKRLQAWTMWSSQRGWRFLPALFLIAAIVLGVSVTKPWKSDQHSDSVLVTQKQNEPIPTEGAIPKPAPPSNLTKVENLAGAAPPAPPSLLVAAKNNAPVADKKKEEIKKPEAKGATEAAEATDSEAAAQKEADESDKTPYTLPGGKGNGMIYRGELTVTQFTAVWPAIREKIEALNGKAAGAVELGWLRHPDESYFHFTLPESNYPDLEAYLKTFGPVRIVKDRHPRVMPKGQIRIILTVKDGETHENPAAAP